MNRQKRSRKIFRFREDILINMCPRSQRLRWHGASPSLHSWTLPFVMVPGLSPMLWSLSSLLCYGHWTFFFAMVPPRTLSCIMFPNPLLCYGHWTLSYVMVPGLSSSADGSLSTISLSSCFPVFIAEKRENCFVFTWATPDPRDLPNQIPVYMRNAELGMATVV